MFFKLNVNLPNLDLARLQGPNSPRHDNNMLNFREYNILDGEYLLNQFKDIISIGILPDRANITIIKKNGAINPHVDVWSTALNFYLDVKGNEITTFYHNPTSHKITVNGVQGLYVYDIDQLVEAGTFTAKVNDCYLLNTHQPHTVSNNNNGSRTILRLIWFTHDFETVLNSIKIL